MTKAYLLGFIAGATGKTDDDCPYWSTQQAGEEWMRGWNDSYEHNDALTSMEELFKSWA